MRAVSLGARLPGHPLEQWVQDAFRQIELASREENALAIADGFTVSNVTPSRTINPTTCTLPQLAQFVATLIDDFQKRGPDRVF